MFRNLRSWFHEDPPESSPQGKVCDHPLCQKPALHRAPKSRSHMKSAYAQDWLWFCLDHVRQYNAKWNYYVHMSETEVEADTRANSTWHRPSWPLGTKTVHSSIFYKDPFDLTPDSPENKPSFFQPAEVKAMIILNLRQPFTFQELSEAYRTLAKKYHPDANGGAQQAEEKIKEINAAYTLLKQTFL